MTDSPDKSTPPSPQPEPPKPVNQAPAPEPVKPPEPEPPKPADSRQSPEYVQLEAQIDGAWNKRGEPGRFETGKAYNVAFSGPATSLLDAPVHAETLGKTPGDMIHSGELAEHRAATDPNAGIITDTVGGKELIAVDQAIQEAEKTGKIGADDAKALRALQDQNWNSGSGRFADDTAAKPHSVSFTENAAPDRIFTETERPRLEQSDAHISLSDAGLNPDGTPPPQDKIPPHMLDDQGRMYGSQDVQGTTSPAQ